MTRLFYGSTLLAGLCAMTLIVGCGGSSTPTVTCDGGNCGDAKRDTGAKLDVPPKLDGAQLDGPPAKLDGPATTPDGPATTPDGPATIPDGPAPVIPDGPAANLDVPAANLDVPAANLDVPAANLDVPAANLDVPAANLDVPAANLDVPAANLDVPAANLDVRPPDTTTPNPDARPTDTIISPPTDAADAAADSPPISNDGGLDGTVITGDAAGEAGLDGAVVSTDAVADTTPDGPAVIVDADAAVEPGPDGSVVVTGDAGDGGVADAPEIDAPPVVDGAVSDGGGCGGETCHAYTFEGDKLDGAAALPTGFTAAGGTGTWDLVMDGSNIVLEGTHGGGGETSFAEANLPPATSTDETIQVKVRFTNAPNGNFVRICGRFDEGTANAYCLEISTRAGDAGSTNGTITIDKRGGTLSTAATPVSDLDIMVGEWHTYRFSLASSPGPAVVLQGFLDGASTPTVSAADNGTGTGGLYTQGTVALGVRDVTADFDNLIVTTP